MSDFGAEGGASPPEGATGSAELDDDAFDRALLASAFTEIASRGWGAFRLPDAARNAALPLARTRLRFPTPEAVLIRLGRMADAAALGDAEAAELAGGPPSGARERLFDMLMRRLDVFQQHRAGVLALLGALPTAPGVALVLAGANNASLRWLGEAAGLELGGVVGGFRLQGLGVVWLAAVAAWRQDETVDLSSTMAALDRALERMARFDPALRNADGAAPAPSEDPALADVIVPPDEPFEA